MRTEHGPAPAGPAAQRKDSETNGHTTTEQIERARGRDSERWLEIRRRRSVLRVSDGGTRRRWVFRFVRDGKATEIGLGSAAKNAVTLAHAREKRDEYSAMLNKGFNPLAERRRNQTVEAVSAVSAFETARGFHVGRISGSS